jgi:hypothetical protein
MIGNATQVRSCSQEHLFAAVSVLVTECEALKVTSASVYGGISMDVADVTDVAHRCQ